MKGAKMEASNKPFDYKPLQELHGDWHSSRWTNLFFLFLFTGNRKLPFNYWEGEYPHNKWEHCDRAVWFIVQFVEKPKCKTAKDVI